MTIHKFLFAISINAFFSLDFNDTSSDGSNLGTRKYFYQCCQKEKYFAC